MRTSKRRRFVGAGLAIAAVAGAGMGTTVSGSGSQTISVMIASSGPAETAAVEAAVAAWEEASGNTVELVAADDMNLQLGQALAGGDPPDAVLRQPRQVPGVRIGWQPRPDR